MSLPVLERWEEATLDILIDAHLQTWNSEMISGLFVPYEAELVKKIPLSRPHIEDALFWPWTQNGKYSCKFGYRFLKHEADGEGVEETQADEKKILA